MTDNGNARDELPTPPVDLSPETVELRRLSFGSAAAEYDRYRPTYPTEAVDWALGAAPLDVLDLAAGTGVMTRLLAELGHRVTAVEPDDGMRAQLESTVGSDVSVHPGSAEQIPLPDASIDAIVVAQAFHWFKLPEALKEMHRALRPGGRLAVLWNRRDDDLDWVDQMSQIVGRHDARSGNRDTSLADLRPYFGDVEASVFAHEVTYTAESLVGLVDTYSYVRLSPDRETILAAIRNLATTHPDLRGRHTFVLPSETVTYRARWLSTD